VAVETNANIPVPLRSVVPIVPEPRQRARPGFVVYLLHDHKSIMPIAEVIDLPFFSIQVPNPDESLTEPAGDFAAAFSCHFLVAGLYLGNKSLRVRSVSSINRGGYIELLITVKSRALRLG
jgi:hypothetical protein